MTESVNSTVITGRRIKGPDSPEPLTWISLAPALSFGDTPTLAGRVPCCTSRAVWGELSSCFPAPSCCSSPAISGTGFLHWGLRRNLATVRRTRRIVWFRIDLCSRRQCKLSCNDDSFTGLNAILDHGHVAILPLTGLDRSQINRVVCFHHEDKRAALTNLHGLRRHQRRIFEQIENKTHTDEFQRPKSMVRIGGDPSRFHRARAWLNRRVDEIEVA